ncbi:MAG: hypothetical protein FWF29_12245 [Treponema sp.]|nr:hypothetical protein [Treponema sp.]
MRKPVFPRILGLLLLYCVVFIFLVMIQFTKKGNFTQHIGGMDISGQYTLSGGAGDNTVPGGSADSSDKMFTLAGGASVYFGGLEFNLRSRDANSTFVLVNSDGGRSSARAESVIVSKDTASFTLSGGTIIVFQTRTSGDAPELWINGQFASGVNGVDIPVILQRASVLRETNEGFINVVYNSSTYQFSRPVQIKEKAVLTLQTGLASVSYRAVPERKQFNPADYVIAGARGSQVYNDAISRWKDQKFAYWGSAVSAQPDGDMVSAYCGEAVSRGTYRSAVASVAPAFLQSPQRGFASSVFIGGMNAALRAFVQSEHDATTRILHTLSDKSPAILSEYHVFEFLFVRGYMSNFEDAQELIRSMTPSSLTYDMCAGVFESYMDIRQFRPHGDNPFEHLMDQACNILADGVRRDANTDHVFIFRGNTADTEYNLRLGKALYAWADATGRDDWSNLGHSLIMSVLSLSDNTGSVPATVNLSDSGSFSYVQGNKVSAARIYRLISPGDYYPRAVVIGSGVNGLWAWTAASAVTATQENNVLDIGASFPTGETHYMMIRGIQPFSKIQIYNMDYHTDPQFERYDSSGWVYSSQDQILIIKLKHRGPVEHIKIFF